MRKRNLNILLDFEFD